MWSKLLRLFRGDRRPVVSPVANATLGMLTYSHDDGCWATVLTVDGSGSNFFDITFNPNGDFLTFTTYSNSGGTTVAQLIANSKQWRVEVTPTPEPFTLSLFGAGIAGAFALRRRKKA